MKGFKLMNSINIRNNINDRIVNLLNIKEDNRVFGYLRKYCHDVREPLRNVSSFLQIIRLELTEKNNDELLYYIDSAINCLSILNNWNTSVLLNKNEIAVENDESFLVKDLIDEIKCLLNSQLIKRNCTINVDQNISQIIGNRVDILRVFKNLLENSLKHASSNKLDINIKLIQQTINEVRILFSDNGQMLSSNTNHKIKSSFCGRNASNLGLSIIKELLLRNGGNIELVKSSIGCAYRITLQTR